MSTVGRWIHAAVMRKVKSLDLSFYPSVANEIIELPHSLVACDTLEVLRLFLYGCFLSFPTVTGFPALKVLQLNKIRFMNDVSVENFLKGCPLLEDLSLIDCCFEVFGHLRISCLNLKNLKIHNWTIVEDDIDDDGFSFEFKRLSDKVKISCPKMVSFEFQGPTARKFSFENIESLKKAVIYPENLLRSILSNDSIGDTMCELFARVSHVESLFLNLFFIQETFRLDVWELDELLARHLKRVEFPEVNGEKRKLDLARFLLEHGNELEEMVFSWCNDWWDAQLDEKTG